MDKLLKQVRKVILILEKQYPSFIYDTNNIIELVYRRFRNAESIISNEEDLDKINIEGATRSFREAGLDDNEDILEEVYLAETLYKELLKKH